MKQENHFFSVTVNVDDLVQTIKDIKRHLTSHGATITIDDVNEATGECRFGFTADDVNFEGVCSYLSSFKNYRLFM
jgi:hypothetical protein